MPKGTKPDEKRAWMERGIAAFNRLGLQLPEQYVCPLCVRGFPRSAASVLTREHVPPKRLGGSRLVLTCRRCNAHASGKWGVDTHARRAENHIDFARGNPDKAFPVEIRMGDLTGRAEVRRSGDQISILGVPNINPPAFTDEFIRTMDGAVDTGKTDWSFDFRFYRDPYSPRRASTSWLRSAYLSAFAVFGYRYIMRRVLARIRTQIRYPRVRFMEIPRILVREADSDMRALAFVREPDWVKALAVQMGIHVILLPWRDDDMSFHERMIKKLRREATLHLAGQRLDWPSSPMHMLDFLAPRDLEAFHRRMTALCGWQTFQEAEQPGR